jgi:plasmid stability protein
MLSIAAMTAREASMATLTVRNLEADIVRRLRVQAAEHGRSAEAEHREILRVALAGGGQQTARKLAAERLAEFRRRTAGRGSVSSTQLLDESRAGRMRSLIGDREGG